MTNSFAPLDQLAQLPFAGADPGAILAWTSQVRALRDQLIAQRDRLQQQREALAKAWPPSEEPHKNSAQYEGPRSHTPQLADGRHKGHHSARHA